MVGCGPTWSDCVGGLNIFCHVETLFTDFRDYRLIAFRSSYTRTNGWEHTESHENRLTKILGQHENAVRSVRLRIKKRAAIRRNHDMVAHLSLDCKKFPDSTSPAPSGQPYRGFA